MRKRDLLIGSAALIIASVIITLYLVNYTNRQTAAPGSVAGSQPPEQVLSPSELFAPSQPDAASGEASAPVDSQNSDTTLDKPFQTDTQPPTRSGAGTAPQRISKVVYPAWKTSGAHVEQARAVTEPGGYIAPVWSPVALDIAFTREARNAVFLCGPIPGGTARAVINDSRSGEEFSWNADGMSLHVRAADGQQDQVLITGERYPSENINSRLFVRDEKIYFIPNTRAGNQREEQVSGPEDRFSEPVMSPDETRVVYRGAETGLYIAALDGSGAVNIGAGTNPKWLPDSSGIVYDQQVSDGRSVVDADLWIAMADGSIRTNLTQTPGIVELYPCVAPDGERIAFSAGGSIYVGKLVKDAAAP